MNVVQPFVPVPPSEHEEGVTHHRGGVVRALERRVAGGHELGPLVRVDVEPVQIVQIPKRWAGGGE